MSKSVEVLRLDRTSRDIDRFLRVSYRIYDRDPLWVAPLLGDLKKVFKDENPLFDHAKIQLWVASCGGEDVGRIAGIWDDSYNRINAEKAVFFGFFESVNDPQVAKGLFEAVAAWGRDQGAATMLGPMNPTTNDECGLLIKGFDSSPVFMMPYNPEYYVTLMEGVGCLKAKDLIAFHIDLSGIPLDRLGRIAEKVRRRYPEVSLRAVTKKSLAGDIAKIKDVYNSAWEENWGFVPMTEREMDFMAERLKPLLMEGLVWLAETGSKTVGFLLALPDYNPALKPLRGKLLTPAILGFIPYLLQWKRPTRTRVLTLGVTKEYRNRGLESAMLIEGLKVGFAAGVRESEASWILEDNVRMSRVIEAIGGKPYKIYRLYQRGT